MLPAGLTISDTQPRPADSPEAIRKSAEDFEALLIEQMLHSMRGSGWMGNEDQAGESVMEYAEQQLSNVIASGGGMGLARLIREGLDRGSHNLTEMATEPPPAALSSAPL
jgi:flagellar protein FlgJ